MKQIKYFFCIVLMLTTSILAHNIIVLDNQTPLDLKITLSVGDETAKYVVTRLKKKIIKVYKTACLHNIKAKGFFDSSYSINNIKPNGTLPCAGKNIKFFIDKDTNKLSMKLEDIITLDSDSLDDATFSGSSDSSEK